MKTLSNILLYGCSTSLLIISGVQEVRAQKKNILFIMTDQQRYDMLSCMGNSYVKTPSLDKLAKEGIRFERNYCMNPVSMPSRFAMVTGRYSSEMDYRNNVSQPDTSKVLPIARENSIGNLFRKAGYQTIYSGYAGFYCGRTNIDAYGFTQDGTDYYEGPANFAENFFIEYDTEKEAPFFLYLSFMNPHDICYGAGFDPRFKTTLQPHQVAATQKYLNLKATLNKEEYLKQIPPIPANVESNGARAEMLEIGSGSRNWTDEQWALYRWMYCRLVEEVEQQIGRILTALKKSGLAENTIVVFTSDHGEMGQSHGLVFKNQLLEEATRTPLIIAGPGIRKGAVDRQNLTCGIDLVPTICDLAELSIPNNLKGKSLKAIATGQSDKVDRDYIIIEASTGYQINNGHYKYTMFTSGDKQESLIDLKTDPGEMNDKAKIYSYKKEKEHLRTLLVKNLKERGLFPFK